MFISIIRKLKAILSKLTAKEVANQERKLELAAVAIDDAEDLCKERMKFAEKVQQSMEARALDKYVSDVIAANDAKAKAADTLKELQG